MSNKNQLKALLAIIASVALAGCLPEETSVNPNEPSNPGQSNSPPVIGGAPGVQATVGVTYLFQPSALDSNGDALSFSATGLPAWASINSQSGLVSGTPATAHIGTAGPIVVTVSDGRASASLPAFLITVGTTAPPLNLPPVLSGSPVTTIAAGTSFSFTPTASDPEGGTLVFSVSLNGNLGSVPSWAAFNASTGQLSGTAQAGIYVIVITATDTAAATASLAFTLIVTQPSSTGSAELSWSRPTQNTDGTALTDLAGYRIYHGLSVAQLDDVIEVTGGDSTSHTFNGLASGTHYFAVAAVNSAGMEGALSGVGSKSIP